MINGIFNAIKFGNDQSIAAERGGGKTSITVGVTILCILSGLSPYTVVTANTGADATRLMREIKNELEFNDLLAADFPEVCVPIRELQGAPSRGRGQTIAGRRTRLEWGGDKDAILPSLPPKIIAEYNAKASGAIISARGMDSSIRGLMMRGKRPSACIIDDPDTRESAYSEKQTEDRLTLIENDLAGLGGPGRMVPRIILCTTINRTCVAYIYTDPKQKPGFRPQRHGFFASWPTHKDHWDRYIKLRRDRDPRVDPDARVAHQYYVENQRIMDDGAEVSNPERYDGSVQLDGEPKELTAIQHAYNYIADKGMDSFLAEWQNDPRESDEEAGEFKSHEVTARCTRLDEFVVPDGMKTLTAMIDLGKNVLHWSGVASGRSAEAHVPAYGIERIDRSRGQSVESGILDAGEKLVKRIVDAPWRTESGEVVRVRRIGIDCGHWNNVAYALVKKFPKICRAMMGLPKYQPQKRTKDRKPGFECWESRQGRSLWVINHHADYWKRRVHDGLRLPSTGPGGARRSESLTIWGEHDDHLDEATARFAEQIVAEQWIDPGLRKPRGVFTRGSAAISKGEYVQVHRQNHYLDTTSGALCLAGVEGVRPPGVGQDTRKDARKTLQTLEQAMGQGRRAG